MKPPILTTMTTAAIFFAGAYCGHALPHKPIVKTVYITERQYVPTPKPVVYSIDFPEDAKKTSEYKAALDFIAHKFSQKDLQKW